MTQTAPADTARSLRVVLVEDDELITLLLEDMLTDLGHVICATAASEEEAVSAAEREKPDLMVLDFHLRQGNGGAAMDRILCHGPMPHIFVTGGNIEPERPGAVLLSKPFMEHQLRAAVEKAVAT